MMRRSPQSDQAPSLPRISDYVAWYADRTPEAESLVLDDARLSYSQLNSKVDSLAKALLHAGVTKGDRVAALCTPAPDYFITFLAAVSIGAIWVGLNPRYRLPELAYITGDCEPVVLFARTRIDDRDYSEEIRSLIERTPSIRTLVLLDRENECSMQGIPYERFIDAGTQIENAVLEEARGSCGDRDPCMIVYTSGSTGKSKGALLHHQGVVEFSLGQNRAWPVSPLRTLNYFPINHIGCVADVSTPTLTAGGTIIFLEQFSPLRSLELMQSEQVTLWFSVPSAFHLQMSESTFPTFDLSAVQLIVWEGAAMPREMIVRLLSFDRPMATNYSMTESCGAITIVEPTRDLETLERTVGFPFEDVEVRLVDGSGCEVAEGETGEIQARSIYNMSGYWRRPEATAEAISPDGWLSTGDLGRRNSDGSYSIVGRVKEMYKSGGYNVYPREIENVIESHEAVEMAAVVSVEDPVWQEVGIAYVLLNSSSTVGELEAHCRRHLANYKIPKKFVIQDEMPLLPIGKVDKVTLKKRADGDYLGSASP